MEQRQAGRSAVAECNEHAHPLGRGRNDAGTIPPTSTVTIRDALVRDLYSVTQVLAAACASSLVGRWLDPFADSRGQLVSTYAGVLASGAISSGVVRVVEDGGEIVGAALWTLHERGLAESSDSEVRFNGDPGPVMRDRRAALMSAAERCRPRHAAHQQLVYLGVLPDRQRRGIGTSLLTGHHALLYATGTPSYALADDIRTRDVLVRHGYSGIGPARVLPGGLSVWPMWRRSGPAVPS